ncbi:hypothetical protein RB653_009832 [Dictyostelium firmibasis]|uniref:EamA domain-containing protein n=1 Tax=Dictyostelium firmibasis TaxID=79012 RepID=A0AAN7YKG7_9MYCE
MIETEYDSGNTESVPLSIILQNNNENNINNSENNNNNNDNENENLNELINIETDKGGRVVLNKENQKVPIFAYIILGFALFAMSSSGVALKSIDAPPLLKASWRLQSTSVLLFFGLIYEITMIYNFHKKIIQKLPKQLVLLLPNKILNIYNNFDKLKEENELSLEDENEMNSNYQDNLSSKKEEIEIEKKDIENEKNKEEIKSKLFEKKTILILLGTGIVLGFHFSFWVVSLDKTTLAHSLLFVTSSPIMIVLVMLVRRAPISKGEIIGCILGFIGLIITLFDSLFLNQNDNSSGSDSNSGGNSNGNSGVVNRKSIQNPTVFGDFLALMGAVCIVFYLFAGSLLRKWMPLFCYAFPVTFIAAIFCSIASLILEETDLFIFGWVSKPFILLTCYLAVFPGFIGHTGMNAIIKYIEPVVISVTLLLEPPIGSLMGYIVGVEGLPTFFTYIGGPFIIGGCLLVTISSHIRNKKQQLE